MIYCLIAAALWAVAVSLFRPAIDAIGPMRVNLAKCAIAAVAFWIWVALTNPGFGEGGATEWTLLAASGLVGMSIGDVLLFLAVREGGVQRALVLFNTSPILAALLAMPVYGEMLPLHAWFGIAAIVAGVTAVETDPVRRSIARPLGARSAGWVVVCAGLGAAAGQALGIVMTRGPLQVVPVLPASAVRLTTAAVGLALISSIWVRPTSSGEGLTPRWWLRLTLPTTIGTVVAVYFMMLGIREVPAGISATLLATPPLFALPISRFVLREPLGVRSVAGTILAVGGVGLLQIG